MAVSELEKENKLKVTDIHQISELVFNAIDLKVSVRKEETVNSKESILDLLTEMLEMMLTANINLTRGKKLEIIHLLSKLKANKEYMNLVKGNIIQQQQTFTKIHTSAEHMFKKSQSAFGNT